MTIIVSTRQLLDIEDFFGTSANCTVGIYTFIVKKYTSGSWITTFEYGLMC